MGAKKRFSKVSNRVSIALKGRKLSDETKEKMSQSQIKRWAKWL